MHLDPQDVSFSIFLSTTPQGVEVSYRSKLRYVGAFLSHEEATAANRAFRKMTTEIDEEPLSSEEVEARVKTAKDAALDAASRAKAGDTTVLENDT